MATVTCPSCGLPRAPDLIDSAACPVCGTVGTLPEAIEVPLAADPPALPAAATVEPPGPQPPPAKSAGLAVGLGVGLAVGVGVGVGLTAALRHPVYYPQYVHLPAPTPGTPGIGVMNGVRIGAENGVRVGPELRPVAPMPREAVALAAVPPGGSRPPLTKTEPATLTLDNPDGTSSPYVRPGGTLVLRGKVKKLVVSGLEGGATLDCSGLLSTEVVVIGPVVGGSRLTVRAPAGRVTFVPRENAVGGTIGGGSTVDVLAKEVGLHARIDGAGTRVAVRLTEAGALTFAEVDGPARLEYAAEPRGGPEPKVIAGRVGTGAVVRKVD